MPAQIEAEVEVNTKELNSVESRLQELDGREVGVKVTEEGVESTQRRIDSINGSRATINVGAYTRSARDEIDDLKQDIEEDGIDLDLGLGDSGGTETIKKKVEVEEEEFNLQNAYNDLIGPLIEDGRHTNQANASTLRDMVENDVYDGYPDAKKGDYPPEVVDQVIDRTVEADTYHTGQIFDRDETATVGVEKEIDSEITQSGGSKRSGASIKPTLDDRSVAIIDRKLDNLARDRKTKVKLDREGFDSFKEDAEAFWMEGGGRSKTFNTTHHTTYEEYFHRLSKEEKERLEEVRGMGDMENNVDIGVNVDGEDLASAEAALNRVARDRSTTIEVDQQGGITATLGDGGSNVPSFGGNALNTPSKQTDEIFPDGPPGGKSNPGRLTWSQLGQIGTQPGLASGIPQQQQRMANQMRGVPSMGNAMPQMRKPNGDLRRVNRQGASFKAFASDQLDFFDDRKDKKGGIFGKLNDSAEKLKESLSEATLSMSQLYNLFAALLPVLASVAAQAAGVAVAFGAIAGAGATLIAGGLLAQGNDLQSSIQQTKEDLSELKTELYDVFQGPMSEMSSFANQWLDKLPQRMEPLANAMGGATAFQGLFDQMTVDVINGIASAITILNEKVEKIGDIYQDLAGPLGGTLLSGLEWLINQAHENRNVLKGLGGALLAVGAAIYNIGELIGRVISRLQWFFKMMGGIVSLLNNRLIGTLLSTVVMLGILAKTVGTVSLVVGGMWKIILSSVKAWGMLTAMVEAFMGKAILTKIGSIIAAVTGLNLTLMQTAALVAAVTGGLALLGAGIAFGDLGPSGFGGGGFGKSGSGVGGPTPGGPSQRPHSMKAPGGSGNEVNIHLNGQTTDKQIDKIERVTRATINDEKQISGQR